MPRYASRFEGEVFLHQETKCCGDASGNHFRRSRIEMAYFYEKFEAYVVDEDAHSYYEQIAHKL
jgi:hypothetical protein